MKAKEKVQEAPAAPQPIPTPDAPQVKEDTRDWATCDWSLLVNLITNPSPDDACTAFHVAFERTVGVSHLLWEGDQASLTPQDWQGLASVFELNANVMREAFEVVFEAFRRRSIQAGESHLEMPAPIEK
jgi:hypothetical protein